MPASVVKILIEMMSQESIKNWAQSVGWLSLKEIFLFKGDLDFG